MTLLPKIQGLKLHDVAIDAGMVSLFVESTCPSAGCPVCGRESARLHSHYQRTLTDLPWSGRLVRLSLRLRRFRCSYSECPRRIFAERLPDLVEPYARKTIRLREIIELVGFALGGEGGARLLGRLGMRASPSTLLRYVRGSPMAVHPPPTIIGVDDFALLRGRKYGTIIVDLEHHRPIEMLPDRSTATLAAWLAENPCIEVVARDRYQPYAEAVNIGAPRAVQVVDRFHLVNNLYDALEKAIERNRGRLRDILFSEEVDPEAFCPDDLMQNADRCKAGEGSDPEKRNKRLERYQRVVELRSSGLKLEDIAFEVGLSRRTVIYWLKAGRFPERKRRTEKKPGVLDSYADHLRHRFEEGCVGRRRPQRRTRLLRRLPGKAVLG